MKSTIIKIEIEGTIFVSDLIAIENAIKHQGYNIKDLHTEDKK